MHAIKSWTKYSQNTDPTDLRWQNIRWPFGIKMNIDRFQVYLINQIKLSRLDARTTTKGLARNPYMYRSITNSHIIRWGIPSLFLINSITCQLIYGCNIRCQYLVTCRRNAANLDLTARAPMLFFVFPRKLLTVWIDREFHRRNIALIN